MYTDAELKWLESHLKTVFRGKVIEVYPDSYTCSVITAHGVRYHNLPYGQAGSFAGSAAVTVPEVGTPVLLIAAGSTVDILKFFSAKGRGEPNYPVPSYVRVNSVTEKDNNFTEKSIYQAGQPIGVLQGDHIVGNKEGAYLAILRGGMASLGSGPNVAIHAFSTDDLLRLCSRNYQQFTDAGHTQITNDEGEVTTERYHSMMYFETVGEDATGSDYTVPDDAKETIRQKKTEYDRMAKSRLHEFSGWLGDVFHLFITKRPDVKKRTKPEPPIGVAEIFVGQDGAIRVRSAREITLEKVAKVRVPKKTREPWMNEKGDTKDKDYAPTPHEFYEWDKEHVGGKSLQEVEHRVKQVDHEELRHFKDHKKDWNVQSEQTAKKPRQGKDMFEGSAEEEFYESTSKVSLRNDGSVFVEDSWGTTFELGHEDCLINARRDIRMVAGRDFTILSGRDITERAGENVDIVAHKEHVRIKANKDLLLFSDSGTAALDSGKGDTVVNSRKGKTLIRAERSDIEAHADLGDVKLVSVEKNVRIRAKKDLTLMADTGQLLGFGLTKAAIMSTINSFIAVGPPSPTPDMTATDRQCGSKTDTPDVIDSSNIASITPKVFLNLNSNVYSMDCPGEPKICKRSGAFALNDKDSDDKNIPDVDSDGDVNPHSNIFVDSRVQKGDYVWTIPGGPVTPNATIEGPKSDANKELFAKGRFRWREEPREDIKVYEPIWIHEGKSSISYAVKEWMEKYTPTSQEVPDAGMLRKISGDRQECEEKKCDDKDKEQLNPFSQYFKYNEGTMSWAEGVIPGNFEKKCDIKMPDDWSKADIKNPKGRYATFPGGAGETNPNPEQADDDDVVEKPVESSDLT